MKRQHLTLYGGRASEITHQKLFLREDEEFLMQFGNMPVHLDIQTQTDFVNHMISMLDDRIKKHRIKRTANAGYTDVWVLQQEFFLCLF